MVEAAHHAKIPRKAMLLPEAANPAYAALLSRRNSWPCKGSCGV